MPLELIGINWWDSNCSLATLIRVRLIYLLLTQLILFIVPWWILAKPINRLDIGIQI